MPGSGIRRRDCRDGLGRAQARVARTCRPRRAGTALRLRGKGLPRLEGKGRAICLWSLRLEPRPTSRRGSGSRWRSLPNPRPKLAGVGFSLQPGRRRSLYHDEVRDKSSRRFVQHSSGSRVSTCTNIPLAWTSATACSPWRVRRSM